MVGQDDFEQPGPGNSHVKNLRLDPRSRGQDTAVKQLKQGAAGKLADDQPYRLTTHVHQMLIIPS
jgi:hypothetical protein